MGGTVVGRVKPLLKFLVVAQVVFLSVVGPVAVLLPPDPFTQAPYVVVAFLVPWPIAYWVAYRRPSRAEPSS